MTPEPGIEDFARDAQSVTVAVTVTTPAVLHVQPKRPTWVDGDRLPEWERLTSKLLGISIDQLNIAPAVSKTIDSCREAAFDVTDVDESF